MAAALKPLGGRYRLVEALGTGGMSTVWRGFDDVLQRDVAIKLVNPDVVADVTLRQRVLREAQAAARLSHPHIASIFDYGEAALDGGEPTPFVVMELVIGESMSDRLAGGARMPWRDAVTVCAQVASALAEAHDQGVVHRDIKPSNVMVTSKGAKVVDFGISALVGESERASDGHLLATPAYVAPERLVGGRASTAADVYGLGLLLYRSLCGDLPWRAETATEMLSAHRYVEPAPLPDLADVPDSVIELCLRCLAKNPEDRPPSAEVAETLAQAGGISIHMPGLVSALGTRSGGFPTVRIGGLDATMRPTLAWSLSLADSYGDDWSLDRIRRLLSTTLAQRPRRQAVVMGLAVVVLLALAAMAWVDPLATPASRSAMAAVPAPAEDAIPTSCDVRYEIQQAWRGGFNAAVAVTNSGPRHLSDATLRFAFPGDQRIEREYGLGWTQAGRQVKVPFVGVGRAFAPGASVTLRFSATYDSLNPLPTEFFVGDTRCAALVSGPDPSVQWFDRGASGSHGQGGNRWKGGKRNDSGEDHD